METCSDSSLQNISEVVNVPMEASLGVTCIHFSSPLLQTNLKKNDDKLGKLPQWVLLRKTDMARD